MLFIAVRERDTWLLAVTLFSDLFHVLKHWSRFGKPPDHVMVSKALYLTKHPQGLILFCQVSAWGIDRYLAVTRNLAPVTANHGPAEGGSEISKRTRQKTRKALSS